MLVSEFIHQTEETETFSDIKTTQRSDAKDMCVERRNLFCFANELNTI